MLQTIIIFLPVAFCLFWMVIHCIWAGETRHFRLLLLLFANLLVFLITDCSYMMPGISYRALAVMGLISQLVTPSILPLAWLYLERLRENGQEKRHHPRYYMWVVLPVMLFTAGIVLTSLIGFPEAEDFFTRLYTEGNSIAAEYKGSIVYTYYIWIVVIFRIVLILELLSFLVWTVTVVRKDRISFKNIRNFFTRGKAVRLHEIQLFTLIPVGLIFAFKMFLFKDFTDTHIWVVVVLNLFISAAFFQFSVFTLFNSRKTITWTMVRNAFLFNFTDRAKPEVMEIVLGNLIEQADESTLRRLYTKIGKALPDSPPAGIASYEAAAVFSPLPPGAEEDKLAAQFRKLMTEDQLFLRQGLSLQDVADELKISKTYVSKMVNNTFNLGFPELVNILRIDYAEQYLMTHRDALQSEVAAACGFQSASSFNIIFKKITGVTPKVWVAGHSQGI